MIGIIAAVTMNGVIGIENKLPFDYPEDLRHFKATTLNSTVIMGRRTFEGIGRPLPKRTNVIITSKPLQITGITTCASLGKAILACSMWPNREDIWLIGGASIYEEGMNYADKILLTVTPDVETRTPAIKFPWINPLKFQISNIQSLPDSKLQIITYEKCLT